MTLPRLPLIAVLTVSAAVTAAPPAAGQGPGRPPARVAPSLATVTPVLDKLVVRVRTPSEAHLAGSDATLEAARDGVATADLTGLRLRDDLVIVAIPGTGALPASFDVGVFGAWVPAPVVGSDAARRVVLVKAGPRPGSGPAPPLKTAQAAVPGFLVRVASAGGTLDIKTVWVDALDGADVPDGAFVFGTDGSFVGLGAAKGDTRTILPAEGVVVAANAVAGRAR